jgi:hypothetical protein
MPEILNINSKKGLVRYSKEDLIEYDLMKWVRTSHKGVGSSKILADHPFETSAAKLYKEKFPSQAIKIAEKVLLCPEGNVEVVLRVAEENARNMYNEHPTKVVSKKQEQSKI